MAIFPENLPKKGEFSVGPRPSTPAGKNRAAWVLFMRILPSGREIWPTGEGPANARRVVSSFRYPRPLLSFGICIALASLTGSSGAASLGGASGDDADTAADDVEAGTVDGEARVQSSPSEAAPQKPHSGEVLSEEALAAQVDLTASTTFRLKNDLEIIMQATAGSPQVSVCTSILAGSRLDPRGSPGAYRVLAEILKEGGYRSPSQDYAALVARRGGVHEVQVTRDTTTFCTTVPAGELPLALWVTAGRFTAGALTENALKEAVDRLAKEAEFADSQVRTGRAPERLRRMAFLGSYEYAHPTLPNPDDLDAITLDTIRELHREAYVAKRTTIAISGGFDEKKARDEFGQHLYAARPGTQLDYQLPRLVSQSTPRFSMAEDRTAQTPAAWYGWVAPPGKARAPMEVALAALVSEKRLGGQLVGRGRAAKSMALSLDSEAAPSSYALPRVEIVGSNSTSLGTIEKGFEDQLKALSTKGIKDDELSEVLAALKSERAKRLETPLDRARALSRGVLLGMSRDEVLAPLAEDKTLFEVSPEDVRLAAAELLSTRRRSSIEIYPKGWQDPWQEPMRKFHIVSAGENLGSIARQHGTSVAVITQMNNIKPSSTIYPGDKLRVPRGKAPAEVKMRSHKVRRGDTLSGLALKYGVSVRDIADANGMGSKLTIRTGETLRIPYASKKNGSSGGSSSSSSSSDSSAVYEVQAGDTLSGIAAKHGVSTVALAQANGVSHKAMVRIGQKLNLPPRGAGKSSGPVAEPILYTVKKGDTLSGIAAKHGVTVAALTVENQISRKWALRPGQKLKIPQQK